MADAKNSSTKPDPGGPCAAATLDQVCFALSGIRDRLDEQNHLTAAHTKLLRQSTDAAVTREAEAVERETDRLKLFTISRDGVLDEVQAALDDVTGSEGEVRAATMRGAIERLRTGEGSGAQGKRDGL